MIYELKRNEYNRALPIFKELRYTLGDDAVIEGNHPGKIYVDDVTNPKTAFAWAKSSDYYLVGYPNNNVFNLSLRKLMTEEIIPEIMKQRIIFSFLFFSSESWEKRIDFILKNQIRWKSYRWFNTFKQSKINWKKRILSGFRMEHVGNLLFERTGLKNINRVTDVILSKWTSIEDFTQKGFGFCLVHGDKIVSWCLSINNSGKKCEVVIETDEDYRNQGFATLTASAFVEHCISNNLMPIWHCGNDNLPSIAVAEKVGFEKTFLYPVYNWMPTARPYLFWLAKNKPKTFISASVQILRDSLCQHA